MTFKTNIQAQQSDFSSSFLSIRSNAGRGNEANRRVNRKPSRSIVYCLIPSQSNGTAAHAPTAWKLLTVSAIHSSSDRNLTPKTSSVRLLSYLYMPSSG